MHAHSLRLSLLALALLASYTARANQLTTTAKGSPTVQVPTTERTTVQDPDEYEIWGAVLAKEYADGSFLRLVVRDRTAMYVPVPISTQWQNSEQDTEAFSDLKAKNKVHYALENKFRVKLPCILISSEAEGKLFHSIPTTPADKDFVEKLRSSWHQFYEEYPGAQEILTISRVGFNSDKSRAMVYIANNASILNASGKLFFLAKKDGSWEIQTEKMIWLS